MTACKMISFRYWQELVSLPLSPGTCCLCLFIPKSQQSSPRHTLNTRCDVSKCFYQLFSYLWKEMASMTRRIEKKSSRWMYEREKKLPVYCKNKGLSWEMAFRVVSYTSKGLTNSFQTTNSNMHNCSVQLSCSYQSYKNWHSPAYARSL